MKSLSPNSKREAIALDFQQCRQGTLQLFVGINSDSFCHQVHPDFSPAGWHLGHIAYTEDLWLLQRCAGQPPVCPQYHKLLAADSLPKQERVNLPSIAEIISYLETVRNRVLDYLEFAPIAEQERLWQFILQHESQHCETIAFVLQMQAHTANSKNLAATFTTHLGDGAASSNQNQAAIKQLSLSNSSVVEIPAGEFEMGSDGIEALDNERSRHICYLKTYWLDRYPVTCGEYRKFMESGGYQNPIWWSEAGWKWLQANPVSQPLYWVEHPDFDRHPVCGVSWYEADAYCRFVGKRLPTEAEWEKAASWDAETATKYSYPWGNEKPKAYHCNYDNQVKNTTPVGSYLAGISPYGCSDMIGNVWEWTDTWFEPYQGFQSYPYPGYSQVYFDGEHRVLRGGSWATRPWSLRSTFRNWYHPGSRQILAGFRCASS